ncbi:hypothetical protein RJ641_012304 [Dillenia turbinata]|uniref:SLH domain-containing protein n=1 Tax=Dillenia turbinata TaxID=194707 RepID=A0AAN8Z281_9MAGN
MSLPSAIPRLFWLPLFLLAGVGTSVAVCLAAIAFFWINNKGSSYRISNPLHFVHEILTSNKTNISPSIDADSDLLDEAVTVTEASPAFSSDTVGRSVTDTSTSQLKTERVTVSVALDSTQQEALSLLKKLKIIENDVKGDELCTKREYARWLVHLNSYLERSPKHRIVPSILMAGSVVAAFDDVAIEDQDFVSIQALAEAGIIFSKLSKMSDNSAPDVLIDQEGLNFFPERFIFRKDLINWKAQLEYEFISNMGKEISRRKVAFMDMKEISAEASPGLLMDMMAGDKSIHRKVFGQMKRFQPSRPSTKAQAAVALTSGKMTEAIHGELQRLEAENSARFDMMEEIKSELLGRGDIEKFWQKKIKEVRTRGLGAERSYEAAVYDLKQEKLVQEKYLSEYLKKKGAIDCQRQLLLSLKEEVNEMLERLSSERILLTAEQHSLQNMRNDLQAKQEGILDAKSILESQIEALRIYRSWVEEEARKSQTRAKFLEEVTRRWKWEKQG